MASGNRATIRARSTMSPARPQNGEGLCAGSRSAITIMTVTATRVGRTTAARVVPGADVAAPRSARRVSPPRPEPSIHSRCGRLRKTRARSRRTSEMQRLIVRASQPVEVTRASCAPTLTRPTAATRPVAKRSASRVRRRRVGPSKVWEPRSSSAFSGTGGRGSLASRKASDGMRAVSARQSAEARDAAPWGARPRPCTKAVAITPRRAVNATPRKVGSPSAMAKAATTAASVAAPRAASRCGAPRSRIAMGQAGARRPPRNAYGSEL